MVREKPLSGIWVHPPDSDDYPVELNMKVTEAAGLNVLSWRTETRHPSPFGTAEWEYIHIAGTHTIHFAMRRPDKTWGPVTTMSPERWSVPDGTHRTARKVMQRFFTDGGYTKEAK